MLKQFWVKNGFTHGFVMHFDSVDDRNYYVNEDPDHKLFVKHAHDHFEKAQVLDFEPGSYS